MRSFTPTPHVTTSAAGSSARRPHLLAAHVAEAGAAERHVQGAPRATVARPQAPKLPDVAVVGCGGADP